MRLDQYLAEHFPENSRSAWQKYITAGRVLVNGEPAKNNKMKLGEDDVVTISDAPPAPETIDLPIIFEDDNVVVINKPVGILSHAKGGIVEEQSVADFFKPRTSYGAETNRPGIIHRLDRATSGVMIGAKNADTAKLLQKQFSDRKAKKTYIAVVIGIPKNPTARLDLPIERDPNRPSQFRVGANGKVASTTYEVIESSEKYSLIRLMPTTGRTHQLRVHMAYIGTPIVGDTVYGKAADRMFLHAETLEITIPEGMRKVFKALVPDTFKKLVEDSM